MLLNKAGKPLAATITKPIRILVLDADLAPALAVARSLLARHYLVDVASSTSAPIACYSRGVANGWRYPDPLQDEDLFLNWLQTHLTTVQYELIIPVTERTLVPLSAHRRRFAHVRIAMAPAEGLNRVLDKADTFRLAASLGIAVPPSIFLSDIGQLDEHCKDLTYPVVIKPSRSVAAGGGGYSKRSVTYARNVAELRGLSEQCLMHSPVILQGYFQGQGVGIELIAKDGEILYAFQHIRLHEVPLTGGGSSFRVSAPIESVLLAAAQKLMKALDWTGVAMVEFKWNPGSRDYCLMEINGRFWGSLPLAIAAGADFPAMLAELSLTGTLSKFPSYRCGVYCRNLASDLMWHEMVLRGRSAGKSPANHLAEMPSAKLVVRDLLRLFSPRHHFDTQSLRDPLPGLVDIKRLVSSYGSRLWGVASTKGFALQQRLLWRNGTVRERIRGAKGVLFVCYGNINRSAVAATVMNAMLPVTSGKRVLSAGFHRQEARPADKRMQAIAAEAGFDLSQCRSTCITDQMLNDSDIIFVMEKKHRDDLLSANSCVAVKKLLAEKVFLLGPGCRDRGRGASEIPDPYNRSEATYRACFAQIHQAVLRLHKAIQAENV